MIRRRLVFSVLGCLLFGIVAGSSRAQEDEPPTRRIPGSKPESEAPSVTQPDGTQVPPPLPTLPRDTVPIPDRWRIVESLGVEEHWYDPYNQNTFKADRPIYGDDWFVNLAFISDSLYEQRRLPTPVGLQGTRKAHTLDVFGEGEQTVLNQNVIGSVSLIKGDTVFRPPDLELRFTGVLNYNYVRSEVDGLLNVDPSEGNTRGDRHLAIQELFVDYHLRNKSDRFDFDSIRIGIQPFISDFRGFLFRDEPVGVRLFGNHLNNRVQYNLAWFRRMEKDTNSGLNEVFDARSDDVYLANLYYQDFPVLGFTTQATILYNVNTEGDEHVFFDNNGFQNRPSTIGTQRPHNYRVTYLGLNGDGHFGRLNVTVSGYYATGTDQLNPIAGRKLDIESWFLAGEGSIDFDWYRLKVFGLYARGDDDPFDSKAEGFDAILEAPEFAGGATSFFHRQAIPLIGGGGVLISGRNALLASLRSSKEQGQSNFVNPGLRLGGIGADFDVLPEARFLCNISWLGFDDTSVLSVLRNQGRIDNFIGTDLSAAVIYRPLFIENIVFQVSGAILLPGDGFKELFDTSSGETPFYSVLANLIVRY